MMRSHAWVQEVCCSQNSGSGTMSRSGSNNFMGSQMWLCWIDNAKSQIVSERMKHSAWHKALPKVKCSIITKIASIQRCVNFWMAVIGSNWIWWNFWQNSNILTNMGACWNLALDATAHLIIWWMAWFINSVLFQNVSWSLGQSVSPGLRKYCVMVEASLSWKWLCMLCVMLVQILTAQKLFAISVTCWKYTTNIAKRHVSSDSEKM